MAGCRVTDGVVQRGAHVRLIRDNVVVHEGKLSTLKRFKDEVAQVQAGQECGMAFENYQDMRCGDVIECYNVEEIRRTCEHCGWNERHANCKSPALRGFGRRSFTVAEILRIQDTGIIAEEENFELIEGEIVPMQAKTHIHELIRSALNLAVARGCPIASGLGSKPRSIWGAEHFRRT